ncbi:MAG TPA: sigma-70 family RNA polymerase sigma factor [Bryobacteraceae bacterium]
MTPVEKLWFQFGRQLSEYICVKTGHHDHCHDILQDVFVKIAQNIDKVEQADNIGGYLMRLAGNAVNDHYRAADQRPDLVEVTSESTDTPAVCCEPAPRLADCCLRPMIESLPPIYRDALIRTQLEGMSQKELARQLGISVTGARSRVQRAREKLKAVILACCNYQFDRYGNIIGCCGKTVK